MCPWFAGSLIAVLVLAVPASAEVHLRMSGAVESGPPHVAVRVDLANLGDVPARDVSIEAEMFGQRQISRLEEELRPGIGGSATFPFHAGSLRPGVYPLALHLQYARSPASGDSASQRGYLLLALGANPPPAVRVNVPAVRLETLGTVVVRVQSADRRPHRVRLRILAPHGLQPFGPDAEVSVPYFGVATAEMRLLRGGAPRRSPQGLVVLAETIGEDVANAAAATAVVEVQADPAWMPRVRWLLAAAALALMGAAVFVEQRQRRRKRPTSPVST